MTGRAIHRDPTVCFDPWGGQEGLGDLALVLEAMWASKLDALAQAVHHDQASALGHRALPEEEIAPPGPDLGA